MKAYGYSKTTNEGPLELKELTLSAKPEALREIANFINQCANEIESSSSTWSHEHIKWQSNNVGKNTPDIVVHNPKCKL